MSIKYQRKSGDRRDAAFDKDSDLAV